MADHGGPAGPRPIVYGRRARQRPYALIWPKDGKRSGKFGRLKDILTNEGPQIYVASHRGRGLGWDAPRRSEWSGWRELDTLNFTPWGHNSTVRSPFPWARDQGRARRYDFFSRKYRDWNPGLWSDARWEEGARRRDYVPLSMRTVDGIHWGPGLQLLGARAMNNRQMRDAPHNGWTPW